MGPKSYASMVLLVFILGASALTDGARTHASFSASTYEAEEKSIITPDDTKEESTVTNPMRTDPNNRYPEGYPASEHVYNPVTEKYEEVVPKTASEEKTTLPTEQTTSPETTTGTIPNRYEAGYTNGHGTHQTVTFPQYTGDTKPDALTFDPVEGRYKTGYYPQSTYAGATQKTVFSTSSGGVSLASQNTNHQTLTSEGNFQTRYEKGYFPNSHYTQQGSQYTQQVPKPVTYNSNNGYSGNFNTLPFPNSGVPFVASGAGCRTAYWIKNVAMWPSFLTVTSTVGDAFGAPATATFGQTTLLQALMKYGSDPYSRLLSSGTTSLLNGYTRGAFALSHMKVIEQFNAALVSKEAATAQALAFQTDNVESISAGNACT